MQKIGEIDQIEKLIALQK